MINLGASWLFENLSGITTALIHWLNDKSGNLVSFIHQHFFCQQYSLLSFQRLIPPCLFCAYAVTIWRSPSVRATLWGWINPQHAGASRCLPAVSPDAHCSSSSASVWGVVLVLHCVAMCCSVLQWLVWMVWIILIVLSISTSEFWWKISKVIFIVISYGKFRSEQIFEKNMPVLIRLRYW